MQKKTWQVEPKPTELLIHPELEPAIVLLLARRGLQDQTAIDQFFGDNQLLDPQLFANMAAAVEVIIAEIKAGRKIAIVGDYDADGITASAVLVEVLGILKAKTEVWIPSRQGEGYGLNQRIIDEVQAAGCQLLITVDNGIKAGAEVAYAQKLGLQVIITDHHLGPEDPADNPPCLIINPSLSEETYPYKYLAGVGVAFKLASAVVKASTLPLATQDKILQHVLDLVAIGTIGDCVNVLGENRSLIKQGLRLLNKQRRLGLRQLIRLAGSKMPLTEWQVSWQIVPRLNVAGRLDHANNAYRLLVSSDQIETKTIAQQLNEQNSLRQEITKSIVADCQEIIDREMLSESLLVLTAPDISDPQAAPWPEGVIGLVAGRLTEAYGRPCVVICQSHGKLKGSARSIELYNMVEGLAGASQYLERFGGHKLAAGFTVKDEQLAPFIAALKTAAAEQLSGLDLSPKLKIEAELTLSEINDKLMNQLSWFAPFGQNNPVPDFVSYGLVINDIIALGAEKQHLKIKVGDCWAIGFNLLPQWSKLSINDRIDVVYNLEWNEFNGRRSKQLKIIDLRLSQD